MQKNNNELKKVEKKYVNILKTSSLIRIRNRVRAIMKYGIEKVNKSIIYKRKFGYKACFKRILQEIWEKDFLDSTMISEPSIGEHVNKLEAMVQDKFKFSSPLLGFTVPGNSLRLNVVTDSINSGSLYGGVATALILAAFLAERWDCDLRIITRTKKAHKQNFYNILRANNVPFTRNIEFLYAQYLDNNAEVPVGSGDVFLTTSWWTTWGVKAIFGEKRILYLLQEDERIFYPFCDERVRVQELFMSPDLTFIINSRILYEHFIKEGFDNIRQNGMWFEPAWSHQLFFYEQKDSHSKKNFSFYARPNNSRNLFYLGIDVINNAMIKGILNPDEWEINFIGKDIPLFGNDLGCPIHIYQNLEWSNYAALVRKMDLGLSMMYSPHPSYPPLDLAASGAVVVTNRYGIKQDLNNYSKNIICRDLNRDDLLDGIKQGVALSLNYDERMNNYRNNKIINDWKESFEALTPRLDGWLNNVSN